MLFRVVVPVSHDINLVRLIPHQLEEIKHSHIFWGVVYRPRKFTPHYLCEFQSIIQVGFRLYLNIIFYFSTYDFGIIHIVKTPTPFFQNPRLSITTYRRWFSCLITNILWYAVSSSPHFFSWHGKLLLWSFSVPSIVMSTILFLRIELWFCSF